MTGEERGVHLDLSLDRKFLLALLDVVPPGVDEIFAIFRILDLLRSGGRVVIDMAPTGHALEVLRTPGAPAGVGARLVENPGRAPYTTHRSGCGGGDRDAVAECARAGRDAARSRSVAG